MKIVIGRKLNTTIFDHEICIVSFNSLSQVQLIHNFSRSITSLEEINLKIESEEMEDNKSGPDFALLFKNLDELLSSVSVAPLTSSPSLIRCIVIYGRSDQVLFLALPILLTSSISVSLPLSLSLSHRLSLSPRLSLLIRFPDIPLIISTPRLPLISPSSFSIFSFFITSSPLQKWPPNVS
jgi:hypothetical protein